MQRQRKSCVLSYCIVGTSKSKLFITGGVRAHLHGEGVGGVDVVPHVHLGPPLEETPLRAEPIPAAFLQILRSPGTPSFDCSCCADVDARIGYNCCCCPCSRRSVCVAKPRISPTRIALQVPYAPSALRTLGYESHIFIWHRVLLSSPPTDLYISCALLDSFQRTKCAI